MLQWFPQVACCDRPKLANSETTEGMWSNWLALSAVADPVIALFLDGIYHHKNSAK